MPAAARREQLLDAALRVIERDGYEGASIDAIAREANVTRPVVYGVFEGLTPLLHALLDRQEARALGQLMTALGETGASPRAAPSERFAAAARRLIDTVTRDPATWRPILLADDGTPPKVRDRIARDREVVRARIEALLRGALGPRRDPAIDLEVTSHALIALAEYFGRLIVDDPRRFDPERLIAAFGPLLAGCWPRRRAAARRAPARTRGRR